VSFATFFLDFADTFNVTNIDHKGSIIRGVGHKGSTTVTYEYEQWYSESSDRPGSTHLVAFAERLVSPFRHAAIALPTSLQQRAPDHVFWTLGYHHSTWNVDDLLRVLNPLVHRLDTLSTTTKWSYLLNISPMNRMIPDTHARDRQFRTSAHEYAKNRAIVERLKHCRLCRVVDWFTPEWMLNEHAHKDAVHIGFGPEATAVRQAMCDAM